MENENLAYLKSLIGKYMTKRNSKINHWLISELIDVEEGNVTCRFQVHEDMLNLNGTLHGGIASAMMDDMMGLTIFSLGEIDFFASVSLDVRFFRPVLLEDSVKVVSKVIRRGKRIINIECELYRGDGKLAAKSFSDMLRTRNPMTRDLFVPVASVEKIHF